MTADGVAPDAEVVRLIAEVYGLPGGADAVGTLQAVARGGVGRVWRLDLAAPGGQAYGRSAVRYAVKELFWGGDETAIAREVGFRDAAVAAGVTVPAYLRTLGGTYLARLPLPDGAGDGTPVRDGTPLRGRDLRVYSWADGTTIGREQPGRAAWVGDTMGRLHGLRRAIDGFEGAPAFDVAPPAERWVELVAAGRVSGRRWADRLDAFRPVLGRQSSLVEKGDPARLIVGHCDVKPPNVLVAPAVAPDEQPRFTLLDWENCGPVYPERELAATVYEWHVRPEGFDEASVRETMRAYREAGGFAVVQGLSDFAMTFADYLDYLDFQATFALKDSAAPAMRAYAEDVVDALLDSPPPIDVLERLAGFLSRL